MTSRLDVERFRSLVRRRMGLDFEDGKLGFLEEVLQKRLLEVNMLAPTYLEQLEHDAVRGEIAALAGELTVSETYFFRNMAQFRAVMETVLPERMVARAADKHISLISAGCASGEEPYSLAILLRQAVMDPAWSTSIIGVDVNPAVLAKAARGRYSSWAMRETPEDLKQRWFRPVAKEIEIDERVRRHVKFEEKNLVEDDALLWAPEKYDLIFCRNMLMYFDPESSRSLVERMTRALVPGGFLFLGHAETLRGLTHSFQLRQTHGTFYYQKQAVPEVHTERKVTSVAPAIELASGSEGTWVETVQRASERIQQLSERSARAAPAPPRAPRELELGGVLALLAQERFHDALGALSDLPRDVDRDPDVLLLRAVLLTHRGQILEAEVVAGELLEIDGLNAGAHYVLALCREGARDLKGAMERDRAAVYLDPTFAMPHVHLGLMARRSADRATAAREFAQAIPLLEREDPSRLLLFGGGFSRDSLIWLCRADLARDGAKS
jgi:chemotaxis protein methyltransferase CheR